MQGHVPYINQAFFNLGARARPIIHIYDALCFKEDSVSSVFVDAIPIVTRMLMMGVVDSLYKCCTGEQGRGDRSKKFCQWSRRQYQA